MSTTLSAHGGGAQPARIDSSGKVTGGAAMRVYGFASEAEAQAAGYVCEGGPAMSVALITDAQLASGEWKLDGDPFAVVIYTAPDSLPTEGGFAVPVYPVNGWGSAPVPPAGPTLLLDLEADTLALNDGDPVSTWADQSGNGYDFTQTGTARPTKQTIDSFPALVFDGIDDWLLGENWPALDGLNNFSVVCAIDVSAGPNVGEVITKILDQSTAPGWMMGKWGEECYLSDDGSINWIQIFTDPTTVNAKRIFVMHVPSFTITDVRIFENGVNRTGSLDGSNPPISNTSTTEPVRIGCRGQMIAFMTANLYAIRVYSPALDDTQRAVVEAELAARYGVTLP